MNGQDRRRLRQLISEMCDRTLEPSEFEELNRFLETEDLAVEEAARILGINAALSSPDPAIVQAVTESELIAGTSQGTGITVSDSPHNPHQARRFPWMMAAIAASLLAIISSIVTWQLARSSNLETIVAQSAKAQSVQTDEAPEEEKSDIAARIVRKVDCDWQDNRWGIESSAEIRNDQTLTMNHGLMEIEFTSGARITLQGPASLTVVSPMSAILFHGQLTANVPEPAQGFAIRTPGGEAIDLGTRFGLVVQEQGFTQAHVFEGEVIVRDTSLSDSASQEIHLTEDMAYEYGTVNGSTSIEAKPDQFIELGFSEKDRPIKPPVVSDNLALWLSASHRLQTDDSNRISAWGNIAPALPGSKNDLTTAWQVRLKNRPRVTPEAFNGEPGVLFNGNSYLVTDPLALPPDMSACVVFKFSAKALSRHRTSWPQGHQLLNFNGPSTMVMRMNKKFHLSAFMYAGFTLREDGSEDHTKSGVTWSDQLEEKVPHVALYVNDSAADKASLYIDGELLVEKDCDVSKATNVPRYIGSHNHMQRPRFVGQLAECLVYQDALTNEEALTLSKSLMDKYAITR